MLGQSVHHTSYKYFMYKLYIPYLSHKNTLSFSVLLTGDVFDYIHYSFFDNASVSWSDCYMIGQQTGSDKRYFSNEIDAMYRYIYVEKRTILIQLENYDLINVYILRINSDHKECLFAVFEISAIYILYSICTFFRDSELHLYLTCQYHSTNAPYPFYQDKRAKPGDFPKTNSVSEVREHWIERNFYFSSLEC